MTIEAEVRVRFEDAALVVSKMEEGPVSKEYRRPLEPNLEEEGQEEPSLPTA